MEISLDSGSIIVESPKMKKIYESALSLARLGDFPVLVQGETGTGKELVARVLHEKGPRKDGPFVEINCAAIPEHLLESELFGYEKGAFTDAKSSHRGKIERANGGSLLLDEIGDMRPDLQAKLLRVLETKRIERLGGEQSIDIDTRIICTTNSDLRKKIGGLKFRSDLFWRISVTFIRLPPLRSRKEDIKALSEYFLSFYGEEFGISTPIFSKEAMEKLMEHRWPGNVRELKNVVQRSLLYFSEIDCLCPEHIILDKIGRDSMNTIEIPYGISLDELIRLYTLRVLEDMGGNRRKTAQFLNVGLRTLYLRLEHWKERGLCKG